MKFRGFTNKKKFNFVRLVFKNTKSMRNAVGLFQNKSWNPQTKKVDKVTPKSIRLRKRILDFATRKREAKRLAS